ncbi:Small monomeric GTPase [Bertholletia excelsa]
MEDSKLFGVPRATPSGYSVPIRAPPTVDSDNEYSFSINGQEEYSNSSFSTGSVSDDGEEFGTTSERPLVADPGDKTLGETDVVDEDIVSGPSETNPRGEIGEENGGMDEFVVSRPYVKDTDEESLRTAMVYEEEDAAEAELARGPGIVPIAMVSRESDDDSVSSEGVEEDYGFSSAVRVPGLQSLGSSESGIRIRVSEIEEGEVDVEPEVDDDDDELLFEPEVDAEVIEESVGDSVSVELNQLIENKFPEKDAQELVQESFVANDNEVLLENLKVDESEEYLAGGIEQLEDAEPQENGLKLGVLECSEVIETGIDKATFLFDQSVEFKSLDADKYTGYANQVELVVDETKDTTLMEFEAKVDEKDTEVEAEIAAQIGEQNLSSNSIKENMQEMGCRNGSPSGTQEDVILIKNLYAESNAVNSPSLGSNLVSDLNAELEDRAGHVPDMSEIPSLPETKYRENEYSSELENTVGQVSNKSELCPLSDDDFQSTILGISRTTKQVVDNVDQTASLSSLGRSTHPLFRMEDEQITEDSDQEVEASTTGAGSDGSSSMASSDNSSKILSLENTAGFGNSLNSTRPDLLSNIPNHFTDSKLIAKTKSETQENVTKEEMEKLKKIQQIRVKYLRLLWRVGLSPEDPLPAQVLLRLALSSGRPSSQSFSLELAKEQAKQLEEVDQSGLNFSLNIFVLGKTGVGKSATINSIFGEEKTRIDAFEPATTSVKEIIGMIHGVKLRIFDTPGLRSPPKDQAFNRKVLLSIRKTMKRFPPDVVLYVDRLDCQERDFTDLPLFRSITDLLGSSIWSNVIVTLTHAGSAPPDGPAGLPLSYDFFAVQRIRFIRHMISQVVGDLPTMNPSLLSPTSLVENHPSCPKTEDGELILPDGKCWRPRLLLLCYSSKILLEANSVVKAKPFGLRMRFLPLPYLLSSLLRSSAHPKLPTEQGGEINSDTELGAYFEEYDYRLRLLQKKQLREEVKRLREMKRGCKDVTNDSIHVEEDEGEEFGSSAAVPVPLPDMALPPSFDGDNPAYRYRFLDATSQLVARPVLDFYGWDHDCGYDGVSLESSLAIAGCYPAEIAFQITKDKFNFCISLDSSVAAKHGENGSTMAGFDIQAIGRQHAYILRGETKLKSHKMNKVAAGASVVFLSQDFATGVKIEDQIAFGKRLVLVGRAGALQSQDDMAYGTNLEVCLREKDYPIGRDQTAIGLSLVRWRNDLIWSGNMQSQFSIGRNSKMVVQAGLDSRFSGQLSVKASSSDQVQIALLGILPIVNAIFRSIRRWYGEN